MKKSQFFIAFFVLIVCSSSYAKDINITGTYKFKPCNIISNSEGEFYVQFKNFQAAYENDTLVIQNYGNSMNQYIHFKDCDIKFLEFEKEQQK